MFARIHGNRRRQLDHSRFQTIITMIKIIIVQTIVINTDARRQPRRAWPANPLYIGYSMPESDMTRHLLQAHPPPEDALQSLLETWNVTRDGVHKVASIAKPSPLDVLQPPWPAYPSGDLSPRRSAASAAPLANRQVQSQR